MLAVKKRCCDSSEEREREGERTGLATLAPGSNKYKMMTESLLLLMFVSCARMLLYY